MLFRIQLLSSAYFTLPMKTFYMDQIDEVLLLARPKQIMFIFHFITSFYLVCICNATIIQIQRFQLRPLLVDLGMLNLTRTRFHLLQLPWRLKHLLRHMMLNQLRVSYSEPSSSYTFYQGCQILLTYSHYRLILPLNCNI